MRWWTMVDMGASAMRIGWLRCPIVLINHLVRPNQISIIGSSEAHRTAFHEPCYNVVARAFVVIRVPTHTSNWFGFRVPCKFNGRSQKMFEQNYLSPIYVVFGGLAPRDCHKVTSILGQSPPGRQQTHRGTVRQSPDRVLFR